MLSSRTQALHQVDPIIFKIYEKRLRGREGESASNFISTDRVSFLFHRYNTQIAISFQRSLALDCCCVSFEVNNEDNTSPRSLSTSQRDDNKPNIIILPGETFLEVHQRMKFSKDKYFSVFLPRTFDQIHERPRHLQRESTAILNLSAKSILGCEKANYNYDAKKIKSTMAVGMFLESYYKVVIQLRVIDVLFSV